MHVYEEHPLGGFAAVALEKMQDRVVILANKCACKPEYYAGDKWGTVPIILFIFSILLKILAFNISCARGGGSCLFLGLLQLV